MDVLRTVVAVVMFLVSVALILVVVLQRSKGEGLGSIGGGARLFHGAQSALDVFLDKATTYIAVGFMVLAVIASALDVLA